jgi:hypothetical protein
MILEVCLGWPFRHFLLGSRKFMVTALGSCVKWPRSCLFVCLMRVKHRNDFSSHPPYPEGSFSRRGETPNQSGFVRDLCCKEKVSPPGHSSSGSEEVGR